MALSKQFVCYLDFSKICSFKMYRAQNSALCGNDWIQTTWTPTDQMHLPHRIIYWNMFFSWILEAYQIYYHQLYRLMMWNFTDEWPDKGIDLNMKFTFL